MAKFTEVTTKQAKGTLARDFIGLADDLRDLLTQFGLRTYAVRTVRVQWSGGKRGRGTPVVIAEETLLPTPKIGTLEDVKEFAQSIGITELGQLTLKQISGRYTEQQLRGFSDVGEPLPADEEFYYEIEFFPNDSGPSTKRRFAVKGVPTYKPGALQWTIDLEKANDNRTRGGDPQGSVGT